MVLRFLFDLLLYHLWSFIFGFSLLRILRDFGLFDVFFFGQHRGHYIL
jgi:hypothetical protein